MADRPGTLLDKADVLTGLFGSWDAIDVLLEGQLRSFFARHDAEVRVRSVR